MEFRQAITTTLHEAVISGKIKQVQQVLAISPWLLDLVDQNLNTALHLATLCDLPGIVQLLLDKGAKTNIQNANGSIPLHLAVIKNNSENTKKLLTKNKDDNSITNALGYTSLSLALAYQFREIIDIFLAANVEIQKTDMKAADEISYTPHGKEIAKLIKKAYRKQKGGCIIL